MRLTLTLPKPDGVVSSRDRARVLSVTLPTLPQPRPEPQVFMVQGTCTLTQVDGSTHCVLDLTWNDQDDQHREQA